MDKCARIISGFLAMLVLLAGSATAQSYSCGQKTSKKPSADTSSPAGVMMPCCASVAKGAEPSSAVMQQRRIMMQSRIFLDGPAAIYGQAETLGLSAEQKSQLAEIQNQARSKALAALTPQQRAKLGKVANKPMTMMQFCSKMMAGAGKDSPAKMTCPMMQQIIQSKDKQTQTPQQTVCPIMGGKINKDIFTEYKGKKVYFCCPGCRPKFEKEPEKYTGKLPQFKN